MSVCLVLISKLQTRRLFFVGKSTFTIGCSREDDVIVNLPEFDSGCLNIWNGSITGNNTPDQKIVEYGKNNTTYSSGDILVRVLKIGRKPLMLGLLTGIAAFWLATSSLTVPKQDWTPVSLPTAETFGFCKQDQSHPYGIRFIIPPSAKGGGRLFFTPGGGKVKGALILLLDAAPLANRIILPEGWGQGLELAIPASKTADPRILEFRLIRTSITPFYWGIKNVRFVPDINKEDNRIGPAQINEDDFAKLFELQTDDPHFWTVLWHLSTRIKTEKNLRQTNRLLSLKIEAKKKIRLFLDKELFKVRSLRSSDNWPEARKHLSSIRKLVPNEWRQGHRIFDEAE